LDLQCDDTEGKVEEHDESDPVKDGLDLFVVSKGRVGKSLLMGTLAVGIFSSFLFSLDTLVLVKVFLAFPVVSGKCCLVTNAIFAEQMIILVCVIAITRTLDSGVVAAVLARVSVHLLHKLEPVMIRGVPRKLFDSIAHHYNITF
jgi:hypothetical protein